jgi:hypothetical protein
MYRTRILLLFAALGLYAVSAPPARAQGGWDVWTVYLRDGSRQSAAPVWALDRKVLRRGFGPDGEGEGAPVERSRISHLSNSLRNSEYARERGAEFVEPPLPGGDFSRDLVVMDDGRRVFGSVMIRAGRDEAGREERYRPVLVQNGVEVDLTRVAHIKFAAPKADPGRPRPHRSGRTRSRPGR